jgi:CIC family chloride channel protein
MLVGLVAGLGAIAFLFASQAVSRLALDRIAGFHPQPLAGEASFRWLGAPGGPLRPWLLLVVPTIGGLLSGLLIFSTAPEAEGHGTDAAIEAYHSLDGYIRPRVPLVKTIASALTIGTGGSGGREGPIAQIGAGFGSILAGFLKLPLADRRVLMSAGVGAGIAAIFKSPLAGALFASEVLYSSPEFEPEVIIPAGVASVVSYCTAGAIAGYRPLFVIPELAFGDARELLPYLMLAIFVALLASLYTRTFTWVNRWFHAMKVPGHLKPAIGALASGAIGVLLYESFHRQALSLAVLSYGYDALQAALDDGSTITATLLLVIALGKIATTSLTIGSGGSGGVFGPSMVIGGCGGGALGIVLHRYAPALVPHPAAFVVVGMGGFFAAAAKTPFSTLLIVSEMTGGYGLLLPALWVCTLSFILSDPLSIYGSQPASRSQSPAHRRDLLLQIFAGARVGALLSTPTPLLRPSDPLPLAVAQLEEGQHAALPVVDEAGRLDGVLWLADARSAAPASPARALYTCDVMRRDVVPLKPSDGLDLAARRFVDEGTDALPVVDEDGKVLGGVSRAQVTDGYLSVLESKSRGAAPRANGSSPRPRSR